MKTPTIGTHMIHNARMGLHCPLKNQNTVENDKEQRRP